MCITITIMNINAVHSWTVIKKCLIETKKLPRASNPLGSMSQLTRPVPHKIIKRVNEITLMTQSFEFFFDICSLTPIVMFPAHCSRSRVPTRITTDLTGILVMCTDVLYDSPVCFGICHAGPFRTRVPRKNSVHVEIIDISCFQCQLSSP
jgi:hypothetical protein